jgi:16S rRNA (uracil1498-N3)-methyltransferase
MTIHRFFVAADEVAADRFRLPAAIERQVRTVLRMGDDDRLVLLDGSGTEIACRLEGEACIVEERRPATGEPAHRLTVAQALLKGDAIEQVVQHATEIGVAHFRLVLTERCVARGISPRRLERLRTIAREAAEQSERGAVPQVDPPMRFADAVGPASVLLFERHDGLRLGGLPPAAEVLIGPEGGFSPGEIDAATRAGMTIAGLGPRILRSETVAVAAAAVILSRAGDFA